MIWQQIELFQNAANYENQVYILPKHLDEKVARLHLDRIGAKLTQLTKEQANYIGVNVTGPFKPDHYRYWLNTFHRFAAFYKEIYVWDLNLECLFKYIHLI